MFSTNPASGATTLIHAFSGNADGGEPAAALHATGGLLYGTTQYGGASLYGTIFAINIATGKLTTAYTFNGHGDAELPASSLLQLNGLLYGTTTSGGLHGYGTVFSFDPASGQEIVLYAFTNGLDGARPSAGLTDVGGVLYGTTSSAGANGFGTVFSLEP